jgi:bifunctional UDP-N-acetylglucosamine pyrophosphorylase/glucosamine-1-phosphate N-acetyltransferase
LKELLHRVGNDNQQGEYYLPDILALAVADGEPVSVVTTEDALAIQGINDRLQLEALERMYQRRAAEQLMRDGVALSDRDRIDIRGALRCGQDVVIDINTVFEGEVVLEGGVTVGANCLLKNCHIGAGTVVDAYSYIDGATIAANCRIGPFARIRPGTHLGSGARIGNFVETKNSRFGAGSKANHLAYIGDSDVGDACNIGAGTITCNYDGVNKHRTQLGDEVFVGSNSTLVAPLHLADGCFVGAGSTVTDNADSKTLVIGRARQRAIKGWQRPESKKDT